MKAPAVTDQLLSASVSGVISVEKKGQSFAINACPLSVAEIRCKELLCASHEPCTLEVLSRDTKHENVQCNRQTASTKIGVDTEQL
jgi:hypothetical protein